MHVRNFFVVIVVVSIRFLLRQKEQLVYLPNYPPAFSFFVIVELIQLVSFRET